jgi:hypothetical protein
MFTRVKVLGAAGAISVALLGAGPAFADFVCPVLPVPGQATSHSDQFITLPNGDVSILPGKAGDAANSPVDVPDTATNDNGNGNPGGAHDAPGDDGYTGIWNAD